ncbi:MAG: YggS family pyridoxal phosphate enzyme [Gammaproteobacteria bacterium RIFCSPHIGHO2_12_FULL_38_11]|nr:MAG: YggS family pyridoxal phosphate enzyme [Gammaproteobacteria bacterium RIFCSPHIGHO2_12_FULL_38_11]
METLSTKLASINKRICAAKQQKPPRFAEAQRPPFSKEIITLIAASKKQSVGKIREAFNAGQHKFAENYLQEALEKQHLLSDLAIEWHFIGTIQSNKTKLIAAHFDWVQSVNRLSIARRLSDQRPANLNALNICIEVNIDESPTKSGVLPKAIFELATEIKKLNHLNLRGLMVIPEKNNIDAFQKTARLYAQLISAGFALDTLSMGMSDDFESAIAAGSNMVRIGTAIFGKR